MGKEIAKRATGVIRRSALQSMPVQTLNVMSGGTVAIGCSRRKPPIRS